MSQCAECVLATIKILMDNYEQVNTNLLLDLLSLHLEIHKEDINCALCEIQRGELL